LFSKNIIYTYSKLDMELILMYKSREIVAGVALTILLAGCSNMSTSETVGTVGGAAAGGAIGYAIGGNPASAIGGAAVGAVVGQQIGKNIDKNN
jgi:osmotically inducible lipoprotein OsmB